MHNQCHTRMYVIVCSHLSQLIAHSTQCTCTHFVHQFSALITTKPLHFVMSNASHILCYRAIHTLHCECPSFHSHWRRCSRDSDYIYTRGRYESITFLQYLLNCNWKTNVMWQYQFVLKLLYLHNILTWIQSSSLHFSYTSYIMFIVPRKSPHISSLSREDATTGLVHWDLLTLDELSGFLDSYIVVSQELKRHTCADIDIESGEAFAVTTEYVQIVGLHPTAEYCVGVAASTAAGVGNYSQGLLPCKDGKSTAI